MALFKLLVAVLGALLVAVSADAADGTRNRQADRFLVPGACVLIVETVGGKVQERQHCEYTADQIVRMREGKGATGK